MALSPRRTAVGRFGVPNAMDCFIRTAKNHRQKPPTHHDRTRLPNPEHRSGVPRPAGGRHSRGVETMIYTNPFDVLLEAGFTPETFYIHPAYHSPASYVPVWHLTERRWELERRATDPDDHRITDVLE